MIVGALVSGRLIINSSAHTAAAATESVFHLCSSVAKLIAP
jgi:hypothetical protein